MSQICSSIPSRLVLLGVLLSATLGLLLSLRSTGQEAPKPSSWTGEITKERLVAFLKSGKHRGWVRDAEVRYTGPVVGGKYFGSHPRVIVYYSPEVHAWLKAGRPPGRLPDGAVIVKEQYGIPKVHKDVPRQTDPPLSSVVDWTVMIRSSKSSHDGWYWAWVSAKAKPDAVTPDLFEGKFGNSACINCHASALSDSTFASLHHIAGGKGWQWKFDPSKLKQELHISHLMPNVETSRDLSKLPTPLAAPDKSFLARYGARENTTRTQLRSFPADDEHDHVVAEAGGPRGFLTSNQCLQCHDASYMMYYARPNMAKLVETDQIDFKLVNLSPYGEWSVSLMGLAGRDPVFHAQLEREKNLRPQAASLIDNTCYKCHGVMGQRQLASDRGELFAHEMIYATGKSKYARYGALARDGVSCGACHRMAPTGLGTAKSFVANFLLGPPNEIYGPYKEKLQVQPMKNALGITPRAGEHLRSAAMCGSCHNVNIPKVPLKYKPKPGVNPFDFEDPALKVKHEQTTYSEWRNSVYQNERAPVDAGRARTCQGCHMPTTFSGEKLAFKVANFADDTLPVPPYQLPADKLALQVRQRYARHTLTGINLFVMEMFQQFRPLLGIATNNYFVPSKTVNSLLFAEYAALRMARSETARVALLSVRRAGERLEARVRVTSLVGHKFPSGVGFRRAFLTLRVLDAQGKVLWSSGETDRMGVILDGEGKPLVTEFSRSKWQPHHQTITRADQAQIYEAIDLDEHGARTTSFAGLFSEAKDNRLLPRGWSTTRQGTAHLQPHGVGDDARYKDGSGTDEVLYRIPARKLAGAASVSATLYYQSLPPYYLKDLFSSDGPASRRLHHIISRLNLSDTPIESWRLEIASASKRIE